MKKLELLHKTEEASLMLVYHYDVHAWKYDCKFWLVNGNWCASLDGKRILRKADSQELSTIKKFTPAIEKHEKENANYMAFQKCRKRNCVCKTCEKFCHCASCDGKLTECRK